MMKKIMFVLMTFGMFLCQSGYALSEDLTSLAKSIRFGLKYVDDQQLKPIIGKFVNNALAGTVTKADIFKTVKASAALGGTISYLVHSFGLEYFIEIINANIDKAGVNKSELELFIKNLKDNSSSRKAAKDLAVKLKGTKSKGVKASVLYDAVNSLAGLLGMFEFSVKQLEQEPELEDAE